MARGWRGSATRGDSVDTPKERTMSATIPTKPSPAGDRYARVAAFAEDAAFIAVIIAAVGLAAAIVVLALVL
jgi:hypothetical protein